MKKTYQKPETLVISMGTQEALLAGSIASTASIEIDDDSEELTEDDQVGAKVFKSLWDDDDK